MAETAWAINHPHHDLAGPRFCKPGTVLTGLEVRRDRVQGVMDLRLCFGHRDGSPAEHRYSDWIVNAGKYDEIVSVQIDPQREDVVGMNVRERHASGIIDFSLIVRRRDSGVERTTDWVLHIDDASETATLRFDDDSAMCGILAKERPGEGIVDLKLIS